MSNWKFINKTYLYDGTFDGLLTIVFNCYSTKTLPQNVENEQNYTNNFLDNTTFIQTDYEKSDRVFKGIEKNICYDALYNSYCLYLSIEESYKIRDLQRIFHTEFPKEKYNPDDFIFHITLHIDKDYDKILRMQNILKQSWFAKPTIAIFMN